MNYENYLVDTARPSSPSGDQSRHEYRRSGYDKQGEVGSGSARPEFVSFNFRLKKKTNLFILAWWLRSGSSIR